MAQRLELIAKNANPIINPFLIREREEYLRLQLAALEHRRSAKKSDWAWPSQLTRLRFLASHR